MNAESLSQLENLGRAHVLVIGDVMLDRYTWGATERVSPEAPVLVLRADNHEIRAGGAANVATLLRQLGASVTLAGVTGNDANGHALHRILAEAKVDCRLVSVDDERPTTSKERFLGRAASGHAHQVLRVDHEVCTEIEGRLVQTLSTNCAESIARADVVVVSDYGKGVCTADLLEIIGRACGKHGVPFVVDPSRQTDYGKYQGATAIKPNRAEAEWATRTRILVPDDAVSSGNLLCERYGIARSFVTIDRDGIAAVDRERNWGRVVPAVDREVYDIAGAGDMVMAIIAMCEAKGLSSDETATIANVAAGITLGRLGVAGATWPEIRMELARSSRPVSKRVTSKEVLLQAIADVARSHQLSNKRVVLTNGCFDLLHSGHVACLQRAAELGDVLIVAINSDASVRRLKGSERPIVPAHDRVAMLSALACVDHVVVFDNDTPVDLIEAIRPHVLVKGGTTAVVVGEEVVRRYGGDVRILDEYGGTSTTRLVERIRGTWTGVS